MSGGKTRYATCPRCGEVAKATYDPHQVMHGGHVLMHGMKHHGLMGLAMTAIGAAMTSFAATKGCRFHCDCGHSFLAIGK